MKHSSSESTFTPAPESSLHASAMAVDLYGFTMAQALLKEGRDEHSVYTFSFRRAPFGGSHVVVAGIEPLLSSIETLRFGEDDIAYLGSLGQFEQGFLERLRRFRFGGSVSSVYEGELVFAGEPVLRVEASAHECELVAGLVFAHLNYQSLLATKASRVVRAAAGTPVFEIGVRRAHGLAGSAFGSRAAFVGGVSATSNVLAGKLFGIPVAGTMAHSWVMGADSEREAFESYARCYPDACTLLIDTYDTFQSGLPNAVAVLSALEQRGHRGMGVRLDSGNLLESVPEVRRALDDAGLQKVRIVVSGDLDEETIAPLVRSRIPVDTFGVGSRLVTGHGDPVLAGVYKLAARQHGDELRPCVKRGSGADKRSLPGRTNVLRFFDADDAMVGDAVLLESELPTFRAADAGFGEGLRRSEPLLRPAIERGKRVRRETPLTQTRDAVTRQLKQTPESRGDRSCHRVEQSTGLCKMIRQCS